MEKIVELLKQLSDEVAKINDTYAVELDITVNCSEKAHSIIYGELRRQYTVNKEDVSEEQVYTRYTPLYTNLIIQYNRLLDEKQKDLNSSILTNK